MVSNRCQHSHVELIEIKQLMAHICGFPYGGRIDRAGAQNPTVGDASDLKRAPLKIRREVFDQQFH